MLLNRIQILILFVTFFLFSFYSYALAPSPNKIELSQLTWDQLSSTSKTALINKLILDLESKLNRKITRDEDKTIRLLLDHGISRHNFFVSESSNDILINTTDLEPNFPDDPKWNWVTIKRDHTPYPFNPEKVLDTILKIQLDYTLPPAIQLISPYGKSFERGEQNKGVFLAYVRLPNKPKTDIFKYPVVAKRIEATQSEFEDQLEAYTVLSLLKRGPYVYGWKKESEGLYTIFMRPLAGKFDIINPIKDPFIFEGLSAIDELYVPELVQVLTNRLGVSFVIDLSSEGYYYRFIRGNKELWKNIRNLSVSA